MRRAPLGDRLDIESIADTVEVQALDLLGVTAVIVVPCMA
jgi:hypothetical protein